MIINPDVVMVMKLRILAIKSIQEIYLVVIKPNRQLFAIN